MQELRRIRQQRELTQRQLARQSGVDAATISLIETGTRPPTIPTLEKLARAMGVEVRDFFPRAQPDLFSIREPRAVYHVPTLELEAMYEAGDAARRAALAAASSAEIEGYAAQVDRVIRNVLGGIPEYEERAADEKLPKRQRDAARQASNTLLRHISRLLVLRDEAMGEAQAPPAREEVAELVAHAGVA